MSNAARALQACGSTSRRYFGKHESLPKAVPIRIAKLHNCRESGHSRVRGTIVSQLKSHMDSKTERRFSSVNEFAFTRHLDWFTATEWLKSIGSENRRQVSGVALDIGQLGTSWQYADGSREDHRGVQPVHPRHPLLQSPTGDGQWPTGVVDDIDPRWEEVFQLLADCEGGSKVTLHLRYNGQGYFGSFEDPDDATGNMSCYVSMDLPNLVEAWRASHSSKRDIEVLWTVWGDYYGEKITLDFIGDQLKHNGFDIVDFVEFTEEVDNPDDPGTEAVQRFNRTMLKRRPLDGPLLQSGSNPYCNVMLSPAQRREMRAEIDALGLDMEKIKEAAHAEQRRNKTLAESEKEARLRGESFSPQANAPPKLEYP